MTEARKAELNRVQEQIDELQAQLANLKAREGVLLGHSSAPREQKSFQPA